MLIKKVIILLIITGALCTRATYASVQAEMLLAGVMAPVIPISVTDPRRVKVKVVRENAKVKGAAVTVSNPIVITKTKAVNLERTVLNSNKTSGQSSVSKENKIITKKNKRNFSAEPIIAGEKMVIINIARGYPNRLVMPFDNVDVITDLDPEIDYLLDGNAIYVTPSPSSSTAMVIYAFEKGTSEPVVAMTLMPSRIPAVVKRFALDNDSLRISPDSLLAEKLENGSDYDNTVIDILTVTALGDTPPGYSLRKPNDTDRFDRCRIEGVKQELRQVMQGNSFNVSVYRIENIGANDIDFDTGYCYKPGIVGSSTYPYSVISPGQEAELYILTRRLTKEEKTPKRPRVAK